MKTTQFIPTFLCVFAFAFIQLSPAHAVTFTGDTHIGVNDATYDAMDIVVSNCTLTVDGAHSFASIQILAGGVLTHTFAANGNLPAPTYSVTEEAHPLGSNVVSSLNSSNVITSTIVVRDLSSKVTYTNGADYQVISQANGITGLQLLPGSSIAEGSTNLVDYQYTGPTVPSGLTLTVSNNVLIEAGGSIKVDGKGFGAGQGQGHGNGIGSPSSGGGAGHGGNGGNGAGLAGPGAVYDSLEQPTAKGSGGGAGYNGLGGSGGGAVNLVIGGALRVEGSISANGLGSVTNRSGGGSGGSIWVNAQTVAGSGVISANGGDGELPAGGGGGGGRISIQSGINVFAGRLTAFGGKGYAYGGAGTIYSQTGTQAGQQILIDNAGHLGLTTLLQGSAQAVLTVQAGAILSIPVSPAPQSFGGLLIRSNASLIVSNTASSMLTINGDATIELGGVITADGMGFPANQGRGAGRSSQSLVTVGGGGGYGGNGGSANAVNASGGLGYGSYMTPVDAGSGGGNYLGIEPGGAGGGMIHLNVTGTLIVNGQISANGIAGTGDGSGGGSGGGIWLNAKMLAGAGTISANGGNGNGAGLYAGGGGGGGRIAIQAINFLLGTISAQGGNGHMRGGAGTVYLSSGQIPTQLVVDNGGSAGTNTLVGLNTSSSADLTVSGAAVVTLSAPPYLHNLLVSSNSWISVSNQVLSTTGDVVIEAGGGIVADGNGYSAGQGPGAGRYTTIQLGGYAGGGGGYGGYGGTGASTPPSLAIGGSIYGNVTAPVDRGSGGGAPQLGLAGGSGGGAIHLTTLGALKVEGLISANGSAGQQGAGGGSGGSVWLTAGSISGTGTISANGGDGDANRGGGGGGGRIVLEYGTNYFSGGTAAHGGNGINRGGAGTICRKSRNSSFGGAVVIDNDGQPGTNTSWLSAGPFDLTITGGAIVTPPIQQVFSNLVIGPASALVLSGQQQLTVRGDVLIQQGGAITADGAGYGPGQGPGEGKSGDSQKGISGGGGAYGGNGGSGAAALAVGGATYGSLTQPVGWGSGGGGPLQSQQGGGAGGGAIEMSVGGTLTVLGRISADGNAGLQGGGGSGGSIYLTAGALLGSGRISANGGMGGLQSGGGGGGRIAIMASQPSAFNGTTTAFGGGGYARGGAGTVFIGAHPDSNLPLYAQVLVDNGGPVGTNTSWQYSGTFDLVIRGGGVVALPPQLLTQNPPQLLIHNLLIETNGWLRLTNQTVTVMGNARVDPGGGIVADGTGSANGQRTGAGHYANVPGYGYLGGGGGYGGYGANADVPAPVVSGGSTYGSVTAPLDGGSSGGAYLFGYGGAGGGAIRLIISGNLDLDGLLSAQGLPGSIPGAGGGSGGSIWVTAGALIGSGWMTANGGNGNGYGGGGGGGRIALEYTVNNFSGPITAFGGGGSSPGGAGTIYLRPKSHLAGQLIVDNGGQLGDRTTIGSLTLPYDLLIKGAASVEVTNSSLLLGNLDIGGGGSMSVSSQFKALSLTVLRDAAIEPGGSITLDAKGYSAMTGPGSGTTANAVGSGGGYGGNGGASSLLPGGGTYGPALQPVDPGSSGGLGYGTWTNGSEGGGALRLSVGGALTVNGSISTSGNSGIQDNAGGGSGGSLWISAGILTGSGEVLASGGEGELPQGGGGGGGRIAIYSPANLFSGLVAAAGASGFAPGQDGTIYYSSSLPVSSIAPTASVRSDSNSSVMSWQTIPGITYQAYCSTNLVDWVLYDVPTVGSNGVAEMALPRQDAPQMFFRVRASN